MSTEHSSAGSGSYQNLSIFFQNFIKIYQNFDQKIKIKKIIKIYQKIYQNLIYFKYHLKGFRL